MNATIRLATPEDAAAILAIYAPIVCDTAIASEVESPTRVEMEARSVTTLQHRPRPSRCLGTPPAHRTPPSQPGGRSCGGEKTSRVLSMENRRGLLEEEKRPWPQ